MAQEFIIKSQAVEDKINQLLPSQGGFAAGVDFSASTQIIPIVDLTETAEGSALRQDLQSAFSHATITNFNVSNTVATVINTTGYYRVFGTATIRTGTAATQTCAIQLNDGTTDKNVFVMSKSATSTAGFVTESFDFLVFVPAGGSIKAETLDSASVIAGAMRQIADISGNLVNP